MSDARYNVERFANLRQKMNEPIERNTTLHRVVHIILAISLFCTSVVFAVFGGTGIEASSQYQIKVKTVGNVFIVDEFGKEKKLSNESSVFIGDTIYTSKRSTADIIFPNQSSVRLNNDSRVKINTNNKIEMMSGQVWAFTNKKITININDSDFILRDASGDFLLKNNHYEITSWRHSIDSIINAGEEDVNIILPVGSRIVFAGSQLKKDLSLLRLSKLEKELHMYIAKTEKWEEENLSLDKGVLLAIESGYSTELYIGSSKSKELLSVKKALSIFPFNRNKAENTILDENGANILRMVYGDNFEEAKNILVVNNFKEEQLFSMWDRAYMLNNSEGFLKIRYEIENILLKKTENKEALQKYFRFTSLGLIEDFTSSYDKELLALEAENFKSLWANDTNQKEALLYTELTFGIIDFYADKSSLDLIELHAWLNDLAILNSDKSDFNILKLEIAYKNLDLMNILIREEKFMLAKEIANNSQKRLSLGEIPEAFQVRNSILKQESVINKKLEFIASTGNLDEEDFKQYLSETEKAEDIIAEIDTQKENSYEEVKKDSDEEILAQIRDDFLELNITIISHSVQRDSSNFIDIHRAILPNGKGFSATYNTKYNSLSDVVFDGDVEYSGSVEVAQIAPLYENIFSNEDQEESETYHATAPEDDTEKETIDPTLASLLKSTSYTDVLGEGFIVSAKDIVVVSAEEVEIRSANIAEYPAEISFTLNIDSKICSDVYVDLLKIEDHSLDGITAVIVKEINLMDERKALEESVVSMFEGMGADVEINKNLAIDYKNNMVKFVRINHIKTGKTFIISGVYDIKNDIFTSISEKDNQFQKLSNVSLSELSDKVRSIEQEMSQKEQGLKDEAKKGLGDIFILNNCTYSDKNLIVDLETNLISFSEVSVDDYEIKIMGEFDSISKKFILIQSDTLDDQKNISLEEFIILLGKQLGSIEAKDEIEPILK